MNVNTPITEQMLSFVICGVIIGILYEPLRILRQLVKHKNILTGIEDTLFFALCGFLLFGLSMNVGNGQFRLLYLISACIGAFAYYFTLGKIVRLIYSLLIKSISKIIRFILKPIKKILGIIVLKIKRLFVGLYEKFRKSGQKSFSHLKNSTEMLYNKLCIKKERSKENDIRVKIKAKVKK
ncbi:MAG: hypothetical protein E7490_09815 [Ruminococcaceae bacterium]|nr:hypothetical protein [Oscillospiraceae bacterium]